MKAGTLRTLLLPALLLPVVITGCASAGPPPEPVSWPVGQFLLEGTVSYEAGFGQRRDTHIAHLTIARDGTLTLDSETGVCRLPTPVELERDERNRRRTFRCGDVTFEVRPGSSAVVGRLEAEVMMDREVRRCVEYTTNANGQRVCTRYRSYVESVRVTREAPLRVTREES